MPETKFKCGECGTLYDEYNEAEECENECKSEREEEPISCYINVIAELILFKNDDYYSLLPIYQKDLIEKYVPPSSILELWNYLNKQNLKPSKGDTI